MKTIVLTNKKGGVGKTTTSMALATSLHEKGYKVLVIDMDSQCNLTKASGAEHSPSVYGVMSGEVDVNNAIQHLEFFDILPASPILAKAEKTFGDDVGRNYKLKEGLQYLRTEYDYIVIDTPPHIGFLTTNALALANYVIIPAEAAPFSHDGMEQLYGIILDVRKYLNPKIRIEGVLLTRYHKNTNLSKDYTEGLIDVANKMDTKVFKTVIREGVAVPESQSMKTPVSRYKPKAGVSEDYEAFAEEFLKSVAAEEEIEEGDF